MDIIEPYTVTPEQQIKILQAALTWDTTDLVAVLSPDHFLVSPRTMALGGPRVPLAVRTILAEPAAGPPGKLAVWFLRLIYFDGALQGKAGVQGGILILDPDNEAPSENLVVNLPKTSSSN